MFFVFTQYMLFFFNFVSMEFIFKIISVKKKICSYK